jgi:uncharacterized protein YegL
MKTDIIVVLDRSGSMASIRDDMQKGFDSFIKDQRKIEGECVLTLTQFDNEYEVVYQCLQLNEVPPLKLEPRGSTALLDAIGRTITSTGERLVAMPENERPDSVIFVVITDGEENSSHEFKAETIKGMVEHQRDTYNWNFMFLGANQDAIMTGARYGFMAGQTMTYSYNAAGTSNVYRSMSDVISSSRSSETAGLDDFTDKQRMENVS